MINKQNLKINIFNKTSTNLKPYYKEIRKFVKKTLIKIKGNKEINIIFVKDKEIKELNKQYLKKNKTTDVITFSYKNNEKILLKNSKFLPFGDIYICLDTAKKQAETYTLSLFSEILILSIHGALHLLDYEDYNLKDRIAMSKKTIDLLKK